MERAVRAFFYDYKYYLFPETCPTLADVKASRVLTAKRLKEEGCMAPAFIFESIEEETVTIEDPDRVFPAEVDLYSAEEYDEILGRHVRRVCPGCVRYQETETPSLDGHHREMSLDGVCYERAQESDLWSFSECADYFWYVVSQKLGALASYIDKGDRKGLNKALNAELTNFMPGLDFYGAVADGKYTICIHACPNQSAVFTYLCSALAETANADGSPMRAAGWQVLPYLPEGMFPDVGKKPPAMTVVSSHNPNCCQIRVLHPKGDRLSERKKDALVARAWEHLCRTFGERTAMAAIDDISLFQGREGMPVSEIGRVIREKAAALTSDGETMFPAMFDYMVTTEDVGEMFPYKEKATDGITGCPELSFFSPESLRAGAAWWEMFVGYAYLYVPRPLFGAESAFSTLGWYLSHSELVPEPLRDPEEKRISVANVGTVNCGDEGFIQEFMVMDEKRMFRMLRILAPVLKEYRAKLVVVKAEGVMSYECGYDFVPVGGYIET